MSAKPLLSKVLTDDSLSIGFCLTELMLPFGTQNDGLLLPRPGAVRPSARVGSYPIQEQFQFELSGNMRND